MPKMIKELSDEELLQEWNSWDQKIKAASSWGAASAAADEFRKECQREIDLRNSRKEKKPCQ